MKLLIVDDHGVNLEVLRARVEADGNTVLQAANEVASEALIAAVQEAVSGGESAAPTNPPTYVGSALAAQARELQDRIERLEHSEAQLLETNRHLRACMRQRTTALQAAHRDLESFSHSVSHDLRAPLRAIGGFTDIVVRDHAGQISSDGLHLLGRVVANVQRMNELIDELLEFSRAGLGELHVQSVNVGRLVRECVDALDAEAQGRVQITVGELPSCRADLLLLKQALLNLLSNALKFSGSRDPACIDIGAEVRDAEFIYHVRDNGVGFDMRMGHKLFQVFQRLHAQRDFEGAGVGLAIVRRVIERHGGRVWAESAPDRGATFYFSLPFGGPPEAVDP